MTPEAWLQRNGSKLGSDYEHLFVEKVLSRVPKLDLAYVSTQKPFRDLKGKQRYCDFALEEGDDVRIAIEVDGYDKTGTGAGMSRPEFLDWQRRHASLVSSGWNVIRFANVDVRDDPEGCIDHLDLLLRLERGKASHKEKLARRIRKLEEELKKRGESKQDSTASAKPSAEESRRSKQAEAEIRKLKDALARA
ncbi:MAG: DUF559 domain-containing protein, partial [Xanthomonadales bacterium]|nr:DUF559 domain-containing protein [Xanthomonadales bacterium]